MTGKKGRSGRKRKYHWIPENMRKRNRQYYYTHRKEMLAYARKRHKKIKDYADKHNITFDEARKRLAKERKKQ